jgi:aspartate racemase
MQNDEYIIGVLGGKGTYATIDLFEKYAEVFPAEKEWNRKAIQILKHLC